MLYITLCVNKQAGKSIHTIIHSSFCVFNFTLLACRQNFAEVTRIT